MFPISEWADTNKDNKVQTEELIPNKYADEGLRAMIQRTIDDSYRPLLRTIDKNRDGLSEKEILSYMSSPKLGSIDKVNLDGVLSDLVKTGTSKVKGIPLMFVDAQRVPQKLKAVLSGHILDLARMGGSAGHVGLSYSDGKFGGPTIDGSKKYGVVIVSPAVMDRLKQGPEMREIIKNIVLYHEMVHLKQYFSGREDKAGALFYLLAVIAADNPKMMDMNMLKQISHDTEEALSELEAYRLTLIKASKMKVDNEGLLNACRETNRRFLNLNEIINAYRNVFKLQDIAGHYEKEKEMAFSKKDAEKLNLWLEKIPEADMFKKMNLRLYPDLTNEKKKEIFGK